MEGTLARFVTRFVTRYPLVAVVVCTGVVGGVLHLSGAPPASRWIVSAFALAMAAWLAKGMITDLRAGTYGIDLLAITAIVSTVVVGEYWASLVVCLMLTGGEPMLRHNLVLDTIKAIRSQSDAKIIMYTANLEEPHNIVQVIRALDGITVTLHDQHDVQEFISFAQWLA